ncbi:sulfite exporter TauE/SafE family protein [Bacteroidota bacterium]
MIDILDIVILFATGCLGGVIAGLLGVGGGVIYVFILSFYLDKLGIHDDIEQVRFILSNSFFAIFFASVFGSIQQFRNKNFHVKEVLLTTVTAVLASGVLSWSISRYQWYSKQEFTVVFVSILLILMIKMLLTLRKKDTSFKDEINKRIYPGTGLLMGIFSALSGLGGGVITVPVLSDISKLKIKKATSISLGVMPFMSLVSVIIYSLSQPNTIKGSVFGYLYPHIVIPMVLGVILMAPIGVKLSKHLSDTFIRVLFITILLLVTIRMLSTIL